MFIGLEVHTIIRKLIALHRNFAPVRVVKQTPNKKVLDQNEFCICVMYQLFSEPGELGQYD